MHVYASTSLCTHLLMRRYALMHVYASTSLCTHLLMRRYAPAALCTRYALRRYAHLCTRMHPAPYTACYAALNMQLFCTVLCDLWAPPKTYTLLCNVRDLYIFMHLRIMQAYAFGKIYTHVVTLMQLHIYTVLCSPDTIHFYALVWKIMHRLKILCREPILSCIGA